MNNNKNLVVIPEFLKRLGDTNEKPTDVKIVKEKIEFSTKLDYIVNKTAAIRAYFSLTNSLETKYTMGIVANDIVIERILTNVI